MTIKAHTKWVFLYLALLTSLSTCRTPQSKSSLHDAEAPNDAAVSFTILQLNDIYEIAPVEGGHRGGLARVATLLKRLRAENPNTLALLSGDFLNPSAIGATQINGKAVAGALVGEGHG